jgi:hypothetical protein
MKRLLLDLAVVAALVAGTSWFLCHLAQKTYDFFDMSAFMDAGYRVASGQRLYVDFFYNAGPVHPYLHAFFFTLFGFTKTAVLAHLCAANVVVVVGTYALARRDLSRPVAAVLAALVCVSHYGLIAHPWYDQNASAMLVLALVILEAAFPAAGSTGRLLAALACGALVALSFFTKSNVGAAGTLVLGGAFLIVCVQTRDPWPLAAYAAGGLLTAGVIVFSLASPETYYYQTFVAYDTSGRLKDWQRLVGVVLDPQCSLTLVIGVVVAGLGGRAFCRRQLLQLYLLFGLLFVSALTSWTGSMLYNSGVFGLALVYLFRLAARLPGGPTASPERRIAWTMRGVCWLLALGLGYYWYTHCGGVWWWHPSNLEADYALQSPGFEGWHCNASIGADLDQAVTYVNTKVPRDETLFVFPDATIIYGLTGRPSYLKAPFIFHIGVAPPPGKVYNEFRERFLHEPPQWIVLHDQWEVWFFRTDRLLEWLALDRFITDRYQKQCEWGNFTLLRLKPAPAAPAP